MNTDTLTPREHEVLTQLLKGKTNAEIGRELHRSEKTIKSHVTAIYKKTGCRNRVALALKYRITNGAGTTTAAEQPHWLDIVFDGPPGHESGRFVEVENERGKSVHAGEWLGPDKDKLYRLRIPRWSPSTNELDPRTVDAIAATSSHPVHAVKVEDLVEAAELLKEGSANSLSLPEQFMSVRRKDMVLLADALAEFTSVAAKERSRTHLLAVLQRMVIAHENLRDDTEGKYPTPDAGCIVCTVGTVPNRLNTGLCAYHEAKKLLGP